MPLSSLLSNIISLRQGGSQPFFLHLFISLDSISHPLPTLHPSSLPHLHFPHLWASSLWLISVSHHLYSIIKALLSWKEWNLGYYSSLSLSLKPDLLKQQVTQVASSPSTSMTCILPVPIPVFLEAWPRGRSQVCPRRKAPDPRWDPRSEVQSYQESQQCSTGK